MILVTPIRVVIAEAQRLVRSGLSSLLSAEGDISVVGEAAEGEVAIGLAQERAAQVLVLDPASDARGGMETLAQLARRAPNVRVMMLSERHELHRVSRAIAAGARGFLSKSASAADLRSAVRSVAQGKQYLDPCLSTPEVQQAVAQLLAAPSRSLLTLRQREVLKLVAEGRSNKEIAGALRVSVKTVEAHRAQLMQRLGARDLPALVHYAIAEGLIRGASSGE